ncbi:MAG: peroxide stress protein YaaA [Alphaproteobacteria bacterium]|nr:peroxide stress protein YaaA [Alphaproteobacteria bacterium]
MYTVLSPAKKLDFSAPAKGLSKTKPLFPDDAAELVKRARKFTPQDLKRLMGISEDLANLNAERFKSFDADGKADTKQAALAFAGDVYIGLDAISLDKDDLKFAQSHVGILSGLYGLLRPLDAIQPYRLEMGSRVDTKRGANLYDFWDGKLNEVVAKMVAKSKTKTLINLASNEYFSAVQAKTLDLPVIQPVFKEIKDGKAKVISFLAKKARGLMARHIIENRLNEPDDLKAFAVDRYKFDAKASTDTQWIFTRKFIPVSEQR